MKKIKFRGKRLDNGEFIYGDLLHHGKFGVCIREYVIDGFSTLPVAPDSVTQFVGYDADDNEVYEDDILVDARGVEWRIHDVPQVEMHIGGVYEGLYNEKFRLKGRGGNEKTDF